jgi:hypothetical protein
MRRTSRKILAFMLLAVIINHSHAKEPGRITCSGEVVDDKNQPIAGAKVNLHEMFYNSAIRSYATKVIGEVTTGSDGVFSFNTSAESEVYRIGCIVAAKEGLALGFAGWRMREGDKKVQIELGPPEELAGTVVDEDDRPVAGARVSISMLMIGPSRDERGASGPVAEKLFTSTTDGQGGFKFTRIPAGATAEFILKKEGRATVGTYRSTGSPDQKLKFAAGQKDIKLILPPEAKIEGVVVQKKAGEPVGGVRLTAASDQRIAFLVQEPVISNPDGTFSIDSLLGGTYTVQIESSNEVLADWVAEPVQVTTEAGKTESGVKIKVSKGGLLEVTVTEAESKQPVENASVNVRQTQNRQYFGARTDKDGIARARLAPGGYRITGAYKRGFARDRRQEDIVIEDGKTTTISWQLEKEPKITGVVRDPDGRPLAGVELKICPSGREDSTTDSEGEFEIGWDPGRWGPPDRETVFCLVARHKGRNLAAVEEISEDIKTLDIKLHPGVILEGKVVDPNGKGIENVLMRVMLRMSNWGSPIEHDDDSVRTDSDGSFQIRAVPTEHKYNVNARAEGYGRTDVDVQARKAEDSPQDVGQMQLPLANLSVSGRIVDAEGNAIANARIHTYGGNQPYVNTVSDEQGNFTIEGVCEGRIRISTDFNLGGKRLSSRVSTDGGASGIKIVVREGRSTSYYIGTRTYEEILKTSDKVIAGAAVDEEGRPVEGVPVGVRCIKKEREKGKFSWRFASYQNLSDITDEKGRFAIELEEDAEYCLLCSPEKHAAIIVYDVPVNTKDLKVTLPAGGTVTGQLLRTERGKKVPVPNAEVKLEQSSRLSYTHLGFDRDRTTTTDSEGRFRFENIRTKIRPSESRTEEQWEYTTRIWQISYGDAVKTVAFYDSTTIEDFELVVKPKLTGAASLVGSPLPDFDGIKIDLGPEQTNGKIVLVCFFDMNQRPSRHCIRQLSKRTDELKAKDIFIIAIQAAKVEADTFNNWAKNSGITFPVGTIDGQPDYIRARWSVRSLPRLILTDKDHTVCAEGFALSELSEKLTKTRETEK